MTFFNNLPLELKLLILKNVPTHTMLLSWARASRELYKIYVDNKKSLEKEHHQKHYIFGYLDQFSPEKLQHILQNHSSFKSKYNELSIIQEKAMAQVNGEVTLELVEAASKNFLSALIVALDPIFKNYLEKNIVYLSGTHRQRAQALINSRQDNLFPAFCVSIANSLERELDLSNQNFQLTHSDFFNLLYQELFDCSHDTSCTINFLTQSGWGKKILLEDMQANNKDPLLDCILKRPNCLNSNKQFVLQDKDYRFQILSREDGGDFLCQIIHHAESVIILFSILKDRDYCQKIEESKAIVFPLLIVEAIEIEQSKLNVWSVCALLAHATLKRWLCTHSDRISDHLYNIFKACPYKEVMQLMLKEDIYQQAIFADEENLSDFKDIICQSDIVFSAKEQENTTADLDAVHVITLQKFFLSLTVTEQTSQSLKRSV